MAEEIIGIKINVEAGNAEKSVGSIRQQLREANQALIDAQQNFGEYSTEAVNAAKKVAELKDRVQDAAETAALFDPGQKFRAFSGAIQAVAGGFAAVQGALGLLGVESEDLQKQLLKVQSALAFSEGLSRLTDSVKDFKRLGTVLQSFGPIQKANAIANRLAASTMAAFGVSVNATSTAFKVLKVAIAATGIGLLVVAIGSVVEAFMSFKSAAEDAAEAQKNFNEQTKKLADAGLEAELRFIQKRQSLEEAQAKAAGKTQEEILKIQIDGLQSRINSQKRYYEEIKSVDFKAGEETLAAIQELETQKKVIELNAEAENKKTREEQAKQRNAEAKQRAEERAKVEQDALAEVSKLRQEAELAAIADENERALKAIDQQLANERKRVEALGVSEQIKQALLTELEAKGERERQAIRDKAAEDAATKAREALEAAKAIEDERIAREAEQAQAALDRLAANQALELEVRRAYADTLDEQRQLELEAINAEYDARVAKAAQTGEDIYLIEQLRIQKVDELNRQSAASEEALAKMKKQQRVDQLEAISQVAGDVAKIVGEQTALGKTLAIASAVIETALSAQRAYSSLVGIPVVGPVLAPIAAGAAIAAGIKNVRTIQNTKLPGVAGSAGGGVPSISAPTAAAPIAPQANAQVVGQTLNRDAINRAGSAATRAYVVESDISSSQERTRRIERAARLG